ncbi:S1C family serine protease [Poritiphilus flavus]|uniref:Trypsin-like serine protease n=1 Tax=Poritiphilus flavus TaxID=2697053 RepID=A0A6L9EGS8_9FLAO|nr:trypsin-like peptidase domain-containing protein [Poritiphilus flavus]NAS13728.1 trypsin-like serine protease [Poritiphilus flavus]
MKLKTKYKLLAIYLAFVWFPYSSAQSISELYERANTSVVLIKTLQPEILGKGRMKTTVMVEGLGSGFVVSEKGTVMTASHIVQTASLISVVFSDGEELPAKVIGSYPMADVALLQLTKLKSTPLTAVTMADSDMVKIGDRIFLIGAPFGLGHSLSVGYVSGKYSRKSVSSGFLTTEFIQTDAAVNEGSSGAPLFNMNGEVIGIASFILSHSDGFQGISFAATSNIAQKLLGEGQVIWTGIDAYFVSGPLAEILNLPQSAGILVKKVAPYSLGDALGLCGGNYRISLDGETLMVGGDVILAVENINLTNESKILNAWSYLQELKQGQKVKVTILRKGEVMELSAHVPELPEKPMK